MKATLGSLPKNLLYELRGILSLGLLGVIVLGAFFCLPANVHYHITEKTFSQMVVKMRQFI